jgi:hypothetical protein
MPNRDRDVRLEEREALLVDAIVNEIERIVRGRRERTVTPLAHVPGILCPTAVKTAGGRGAN